MAAPWSRLEGSPAGIDGDDGCVGGMLHHRIVDGIGWNGGENFVVQAGKVHIGGAGFGGLAAEALNLRLQAL